MVAVTVFIRPNGRREESDIARPEEIEKLATEFIAAGGTYTVEPNCGLATSYCAEFTIEDERMDIASELGFDSDPPYIKHYAAFDKVVRDSIEVLKQIKAGTYKLGGDENE